MNDRSKYRSAILRFVGLGLLLVGSISIHACQTKSSPTGPGEVFGGGGQSGNPTNTPTFNSTQTATPTVTATATVFTFTPEGFEGGFIPSGWTSSGVGATASFLTDSGVQKNTGNYSAYTTLVFSGGNQSGQIDLVFSPAVNLTGKTLSLWYYIDKLQAASGNNVQIFVDSLAGNGGANATLASGIWTQAAIPIGSGGVGPSGVTEVGLSLSTTGTATSPFNTVQFYIDDVTIQ